MMRTDGKDGLTAIPLDCLVSLMKERSAQQSFLSSLYFAGAEGDHPYFVKNERIAVGLSVLPEDRAKTELTKKHPHQQEVIFVLHGELILEVDENGTAVQKRLGVGSVSVIEKGQCHRILPVK